MLDEILKQLTENPTIQEWAEKIIKDPAILGNIPALLKEKGLEDAFKDIIQNPALLKELKGIIPAGILPEGAFEMFQQFVEMPGAFDASNLAQIFSGQMDVWSVLANAGAIMPSWQTISSSVTYLQMSFMTRSAYNNYRNGNLINASLDTAGVAAQYTGYGSWIGTVTNLVKGGVNHLRGEKIAATANFADSADLFSKSYILPLSIAGGTAVASGVTAVPVVAFLAAAGFWGYGKIKGSVKSSFHNAAYDQLVNLVNAGDASNLPNTLMTQLLIYTDPDFLVRTLSNHKLFDVLSKILAPRLGDDRLIDKIQANPNFTRSLNVIKGIHSILGNVNTYAKEFKEIDWKDSDNRWDVLQAKFNDGSAAEKGKELLAILSTVSGFSEPALTAFLADKDRQKFIFGLTRFAKDVSLNKNVNFIEEVKKLDWAKIIDMDKRNPLTQKRLAPAVLFSGGPAKQAANAVPNNVEQLEVDAPSQRPAVAALK